jgi:hypothetical protein
MKHRFFAIAFVAMLLSAVAFTGQARAWSNPGQCTANGTTVVGLVNAVLCLDHSLNNNQVGLVNVGNSLNNINVIRNVLNDSPILSFNHVKITVGNIYILNGVQLTALKNFLNANHIAIGQVVGVGILGTGGLIGFVNA